MCRCVVDEIRPLHSVTGHNEALKLQQSLTPILSATSLQLKPEKQEHLPPPQTPSRTGDSEQNSPSRVPNGTRPVERSSLPKGGVALQALPQNDLEKAIEEAQITRDLVSASECKCIYLLIVL